MSSGPTPTAAHQALHQDALQRGQRLVAQLKHGSQPPAVHTPISHRYYIDNGDVRGAGMNNLMQRILRAENVDTNGMVWSEVYSRPRSAQNHHITLTKSNPRSGAFIIDELMRANDTSVIGTESRISELLWYSYLDTANRQSIPLSSLRCIWVDTIINNATKIVA
ncbi:hypothetical protein FDECE_4018 [Fusarium decemcellulare]|nr:hypothetical protein FDECE_4018 [Fusarium decemcellulare]